MAATGLSRTVLADFSGGMYRNSALDQLPASGSWEILNGLLDLQGGHFRRGGSVYRSVEAFGESLRWIWDGRLTTGHVTLVASTAAFGRLETNGKITNLEHEGLTAPVRPAVYEGKLYFPGGKTYNGTEWGTAKKTGGPVTIAGNRLLVASGSRIYFSAIGKPDEFAETDFHEIPGGVEILGLEGARDSCVVFTTAGIWVISGIELELTDEEGNVQQRLDHYSGDIVLWGDAGVAAWEGSLIVPGTDAIWQIKRGVTSEQVSSFERISDSIRDLYRERVAAGFTPGRATVFNNHYLLPIIGDGRVIDFLVCRLDVAPPRGQPRGAWTRFDSDAAAVASRVSSGAAREPELIGAGYTEPKVYTLHYFNTAVSTDADESPPLWVWQTGGIPTGNLAANLVSQIRLRYQLQPDSQPAEHPTFPSVVVLETFKTDENPLSHGGKWVAVTGAEGAGKVEGKEWRTGGAAPKEYAARDTDFELPNPVVSINIKHIPGAVGSGAFVWACLKPAAKTGYVARALETSAGIFTVTLEKWTAGVPTTLKTITGVAIFNEDKFAISVREGVVRAWHRHGEEWEELGSAADATYTTGYTGFGGIGATTVNRFSIAEMPFSTEPNHPTIKAAIAAGAPTTGSTVWGEFTWGKGTWAAVGTGSYEELDGEAPVDLNAVSPFTWRVRKKRRSVSFRFSCDDPAMRIAVKALDMRTRLNGRI